MKTIGFTKQLCGILLGLCSLAMPMTICAVAPSAMDECARELLLSYFPEQFVNETLTRYNIPRDKWASINQALSAKDKEVIKMVEEKASQMNPNPLKDPQQRQTAVRLFRETLLKVFSDALRANGIDDEQNFQAMLDDIQKQKAKKFAQCMQRQREEHQNSGQQFAQSHAQSDMTIPRDANQDRSYDDDDDDRDNDHDHDDRNDRDDRDDDRDHDDDDHDKS